MLGVVVLRAALGTSVATIAAGAVTFAIAILAARALGPEGKGSLDLYIAASGLVGLLISFALPNGLTYVVSRTPDLARGVPATAFLIIGSLAVGAAALMLPTSPYLIETGLLPPGEAFVVVAVTLALASTGSYAMMTRAALVATWRINFANATDLVGRVGGLVLCLVVVLSGLASPAGLAIAVAVGLAAAALAQSVALRPVGVMDRTGLRAIALASIPSYVSSVLQYLNYRLDIFFVAALTSMSTLGLYATAVLVAQLAWLPARGAALAVFPMVATSRDDSSIATRVAQTSRLSVLAGVFIGSLLAVAGSFVLPALFGVGFQASFEPLILLLPGVILFCPVTIAGAYFLGAGTPERNVPVAAAGLVVTLVADIMLIPIAGASGAAVASSLSYATAAAVSVRLLQRSLGVSMAALLVPRRDDVWHLGRRIVGLVWPHGWGKSR